MLIYGHDEEIAYWVGKGLGVDNLGPCRAIGIAQGGELIGGVVYSNYRWPNIELTIFTKSPRWATRETLRGIFSYPFEQLGCKRVTATTNAQNQSVRTFLERMGWVHEGTHIDALPDGDAVTYRMLKSECRWLKAHQKYRKHQTPKKPQQRSQRQISMPYSLARISTG